MDERRADPKGILILRTYPQSAVRADTRGPSHPRTIFTIDLTSADGLFSAREFSLQDTDLIYVTESPLTRTETVLGLIGSTLGVVTRGVAVVD